MRFSPSVPKDSKFLNAVSDCLRDVYTSGIVGKFANRVALPVALTMFGASTVLTDPNREKLPLAQPGALMFPAAVVYTAAGIFEGRDAEKYAQLIGRLRFSGASIVLGALIMVLNNIAASAQPGDTESAKASRILLGGVSNFTLHQLVSVIRMLISDVSPVRDLLTILPGVAGTIQFIIANAISIEADHLKGDAKIAAELAIATAATFIFILLNGATNAVVKLVNSETEEQQSLLSNSADVAPQSGDEDTTVPTVVADIVADTLNTETKFNRTGSGLFDDKATDVVRNAVDNDKTSRPVSPTPGN